jgi:hypothetical protein
MHLYRRLRSLSAVPANALHADLRHEAYQVGYVAAEANVVSGKGTWVSVFWKKDTPEMIDPPSVCVRLLNSSSKTVSKGCAGLSLPLEKRSLSDTWMEQQVWVHLSTGLPPVSYRLEVTLGDARQVVGDLQVGRARDAATDVKSLARFADGLDLVGVEWDDDGFRAGMWATGDLVWRVVSPPGRDLRAVIRLVDVWGRSVAEQGLSLDSDDYPLQLWQADDLVRTFAPIQLPFPLKGLYRVQLSVTEMDGQSLSARKGLASHKWANLGWVRVTGWPMVRALPDHVIHRPEDVTLGDAIRLAGYDLRREENVLRVTLYWRSEKRLTAQYSVFVHVGHPGEAPLTQTDGGPANWTRPVDTWRPGEVIVDTHQVPLPPDLQAGEASVLVGMYDLAQPHIRLPLSVHGEIVPDGAFDLGTLP